MDIISILVLAFIGEAVWETLKMVWQNGKLSIDKIGALCVGLLLAFSSKANILEAVSIKVRYEFIGISLTGILISRGSTFVHDLLSSITSIKINLTGKNKNKN